MNCPSRTEPEIPEAWNQSPDALNGDTTTRSDLGGIANARLQRDHRLRDQDAVEAELAEVQTQDAGPTKPRSDMGGMAESVETGGKMLDQTIGTDSTPSDSPTPPSTAPPKQPLHRRLLKIAKKYLHFIGPGFLISVAYIDPGNYATDVAAGATYRFKLLFMILLSNLFAIFLQSLCIKLGTVTGLNLAEMCREHLPRWLNLLLYVLAEAAIVATDIAEVIGTAIALYLLSDGKIPLVAGCLISIVDVLFILFFYRPSGASMKALRAFEVGVMLLVIGVVICFCFQLSLISGPATSVSDVFNGYLPSRALVEGQGLYQACGILGATVMPHSLYLGSGINQARVKEFDEALRLGPSNELNDNATTTARRLSLVSAYDEDTDASKYRPSLQAIKSTLNYSIVELSTTLFTFALFVNSAILIVAGASLHNNPTAGTADLFSIYGLLSNSLAPAAGTVFALALLLSGTSAGIVCTIAGQMVSEGQLRLRIKPWIRRLMTRSISIVPSIIVAGAVGKSGLGKALEGTQVVLSVILPFVSAPLLYFTCRRKFMTVSIGGDDGRNGNEEARTVSMKNHWVTVGFVVVVWGIIVVMNVALLVLLGLGVG